MAFPERAELEEIVGPVADRHGLDLEEIKTVKAGKKSQVTIALSADERPTLDELEVVSNEVSELFDAAEADGTLNFGAGYTLEVTTPGVDMPLSQPRHWRRNQGRLVAVTFADGREGNGGLHRIGSLNDDETHVVLVSHNSKGGKHTPVATVVALEEIANAVVEIEFNKPNDAEVELSNAPFAEVQPQVEQCGETNDEKDNK